MTNITTIDKAAIRAEAERMARHNDMKQHADKLIQGFEKLSDQHAKRAIWELFQNAIDLSENCEITIHHTPTELRFGHNGKPFDNNTLNCLIKQVSSKSAESNDEQVGQYGTGFITTHSFGRKFKITGSLKEGDLYIPLNDFEIDRTAETAPELIDALLVQERRVFDLLEQAEYVPYCSPTTTFAYQTETELQKEYAEDALFDLDIILPYVMRLNERLQTVQVHNSDGKTTTYTKGETVTREGMLVTEIMINDERKSICSIESQESDITVILPISEEKEAFRLRSNLSRLFLFYPLIGTEQFGMNFIIHSKRFAPTEPRDGIHLQSKNEQARNKEEENRKLIEAATKLIFDFLYANVLSISNPINIARASFSCAGTTLLDEYFLKLKTTWTNNFVNLHLVESNEGRFTPKQAVFFAPELISEDGEILTAIYQLANRYWKNVPKVELVKRWTNIVSVWNRPADCKFITVKDLALNIAREGRLQLFDRDVLIIFYKYLEQSGYGDMFNKNKLLPNIKGEFRLLTELNRKKNIAEELIEIADVLAPEISKRHIDEQFAFDFNISEYNPKQFSTELNNRIANRFTDKASGALVALPERNKLIDYCKIAPRDSTSVPGKVAVLISRYYGCGEQLIDVGAATYDDLDNRPAQRKLIRLLLNELANKDATWTKENLQFLKTLIAAGTNYADYEELFLTAKVYPNQFFELCIQSTLQIDDDIPERIKELYNKVVKPKKSIQADLVLDEFAMYLSNQTKLTAKTLADKIEAAFSSDGQYANINAHPFKNEIMDIIRHIDEWGHYFPLLNSKKANIILDGVSDPDIKSDVFSIISLDNAKIKKLGQLARNIKNIDQIIALGTQAYEDEQREDADFQFKHAIGTRIEDLIRRKIGDELSTFGLKVDNVQNGQDIIIRKLNATTGKYDDLHYIEVKSRWKAENSITMSRNQFMFASRNEDKYTLCCVNMVDYKRGSEDRYNVDDINIIFNRIDCLPTIGKELRPLVTGMLNTTDVENEITLTGDYRATIPQKLVLQGDGIDKYINDLIDKLKLNPNAQPN